MEERCRLSQSQVVMHLSSRKIMQRWLPGLQLISGIQGRQWEEVSHWWRKVKNYSGNNSRNWPTICEASNGSLKCFLWSANQALLAGVNCMRGCSLVCVRVSRWQAHHFPSVVIAEKKPSSRRWGKNIIMESIPTEMFFQNHMRTREEQN